MSRVSSLLGHIITPPTTGWDKGASQFAYRLAADRNLGRALGSPATLSLRRQFVNTAESPLNNYGRDSALYGHGAVREPNENPRVTEMPRRAGVERQSWALRAVSRERLAQTLAGAQKNARIACRSSVQVSRYLAREARSRVRKIRDEHPVQGLAVIAGMAFLIGLVVRGQRSKFYGR